MDKNKITEFASDLLAEDASASGRNFLVNELTQMEAAVKRSLDRGMTPKEAEKARTITRAIGASKQIVDDIWNHRYN